MKKIEMTQDIVKNLVVFSGTKEATSAKLYYNKIDGYLYKIYPKPMSSKEEETIIKLNNCKPIPNVLLANATLHYQNQLRGLRFDKLNGKMGINYIYTENNFEKRIELALQILDIFDDLCAIGYSHGDINLHNILIENNKPTLIDNYSGEFYEDDLIKNISNFISDSKMLITVILSILYNYDFETLLSHGNEGKVIFLNFIKESNLPKSLKDYFSNLFSFNLNPQFIMTLILIISVSEPNLNNQSDIKNQLQLMKKNK